MPKPGPGRIALTITKGVSDTPAKETASAITLDVSDNSTKRTGHTFEGKVYAAILLAIDAYNQSENDENTSPLLSWAYNVLNKEPLSFQQKNMLEGTYNMRNFMKAFLDSK